MNRLVIGTMAAMLPFTASFAGGLNVNLHNVAAARVASLPALPALAAHGNALGSLPKLAAPPDISLPGIPELPIGVPWGQPNGWLPYDVHVWPGLFGSSLFHSAQFVRDTVKFEIVPQILGDIACDTTPDCGGFPPDVIGQVQGIGSGIEKIIVGGIVIPRPLPKMPPPIEAILGGGSGGG
jgi:hypothetical protein